MTRTVLVVDLGTSGIKVALVDDALRLEAASQASYATSHPEPGAAEQEPHAWTRALLSAVDTLPLDDRPPGAVVLTGQMPTLVATDGSLAPIAPARTWQDSRADLLVARELSEADQRQIAAVSGAPIDGRYIIPMYLALGRRASHILSAKDWLYAWLTGDVATEPSTASGYGAYALESASWSATLLALWGVPQELVPPVVSPTRSRPLLPGRLPGVASGTPVLVGLADSVAGHHYLTMGDDDAIAVIEGTSTVVLARAEASAERRLDLLYTPLARPASVGVELDLLATGSSLRWLAELTHSSIASIEEWASQVCTADGCDLVVAPYLAGGEQGVLWRSDLAGSILGITLATSPADLARALSEGIAFELTRCLETLGHTRAVRMAHHPGARARPQTLATLGFDVATTEAPPSVLGVAALAHTALGNAVELPPPQLTPVCSLGTREAHQLRARLERYLSLMPQAARRPRALSEEE